MTVVGLNYGFVGRMKVDEIIGGVPYGATTIAWMDPQRRRERACWRSVPGTRHRGDRREAAENDYRINVKAELEIELLHEKIDELREREFLMLTDAVRMLTELLEQSAPGARQSNAEGERPS